MYSQHARTIKKQAKNQKSTDKHSSFDGLIQEDIDLSDIYLAVTDPYVDISQLFSNSFLYSPVFCQRI